MVFVTYIILFNLLHVILVSNAQTSSCTSNGICTRCPQGQYLHTTGCIDCPQFTNTVSNGSLSPQDCLSASDRACYLSASNVAENKECLYYRKRVSGLPRGFISPHMRCMEEALYERCLKVSSGRRCGLPVDISHIFAPNCSAIATELLDCYENKVTRHSLLCEKKGIAHFNKIDRTASSDPVEDIDCPYITILEECMTSFLTAACEPQLTPVAVAQMAAVTDHLQCGAAPPTCGPGMFLDETKTCMICPAGTYSPYLHNIDCTQCALPVPAGSKTCVLPNAQSCSQYAINEIDTMCFDEFTLNSEYSNDHYLNCVSQANLARCRLRTAQELCENLSTEDIEELLGIVFQCESIYINRSEILNEGNINNDNLVTCYADSVAAVSECTEISTEARLRLNIQPALLTNTQKTTLFCPYLWKYGECLVEKLGTCYDDIGLFIGHRFSTPQDSTVCASLTTTHDPTELCGEGLFLEDGPSDYYCVECPVGTFNELPHHIECRTCPPGTATSTSGQAQCSESVDCNTGPCSGFANTVCVDTETSYRCLCTDGYLDMSTNGLNGSPDCQDRDECEDPVDVCGAVLCINTPGSYMCDVDECLESPCHINADCANVAGTFLCTCNTGFTGSGFNCTDVNECNAVTVGPCDVNAVCTNTIGSFTCICNIGYDGDGFTCSDVDECNAVTVGPCDVNAVCTNTIGSFICVCNIGYDGDGFTCSDKKECDSNPCHINAQCTNSIGSFECECNIGFIGNGFDCSDVNECNAVTGGPCDVNAVCTNTIGSFTCVCNVGYDGDGFTCSDKKECDSNPCHINAQCTNSIGSFECECNIGFIGNGFDCSDVDECNAVTGGPCHVNAVCTNTIGSFTCACNIGYDGDGFTCSDIDECLTVTCDVNAACNNVPGTYMCVCNDGYNGDGLSCAPDDECISSPCDVNAKCSDTVDTPFECTCNEGWTGDGLTCSAIDECASNPCANDGMCDDDIAQYICNCPDGFTGIHCETNIDDCANEPCLNGGTCVDGDNMYTCNCEPGYTGTDCQTNIINECAAQPCLNGGTCMDGDNTYTCDCEPGYTGMNCQTNINDCAAQPCLNGGTCMDGINQYTCDCVPGYTGMNCQTNTNECAAQPCLNGGTCMDGINQYTCDCVPGYTGMNCQTDIDECGSAPCLNGGTCSNNINSYSCSCPAGFLGPQCQNLEPIVDPCDPNPCFNGGVCETDIATTTGYTCTCPAGFTGTLCQFDINECASNPCINGGACINQANRYMCICPNGFTGTRCQNPTGTACDSNPCLNGGVCSIAPTGSYICTCLSGFTGIRCQAPINECASNPCVNGGTCHDGVNRYTCVCPNEFTGTRCQTPTGQGPCDANPCGENEQCYDIGSTFFCNCTLGYGLGIVAFDVLQCVDIDECDFIPPLCGMNSICDNTPGSYTCSVTNACSQNPCGAHRICINTPGSHTCGDCESGYELQNDVCSDINECARNTHDCDVSKENCVNQPPGSFQCDCKPGFVRSASGVCMHVCEQEPPVCADDEQCVKTPGGHECICQEGFTTDVVNGQLMCPNIDECVLGTHDCISPKVCMDSDGSYICRCGDGYALQADGTCNNIDECTTDPCNTDTQDCVDNMGSFTCPCKSGFTATSSGCVDDNECTSDPCDQAGDICVNTPGTYLCRCQAGLMRVGTDCININECELKLDNCQDREVCVDTDTSFQCICADGYFGNPCQDLDECEKPQTLELICPPPNNCTNTVGSYMCMCQQGYASPDVSNTRCEELVPMVIKIILLVEYKLNTLDTIRVTLDDFTTAVLGNLLNPPIEITLRPGSVLADMTMDVIRVNEAVEIIQNILSTGFYAGYQIGDGFSVTTGNQPSFCLRGQTLGPLGSCVPCGHGTYKAALGLQPCTPCTAGLNTTTTGAISETQCVTNCAPGRFWQVVRSNTRGDCFPCPINTYTDTYVATTCTPCGMFYRTFGVESSSSRDCINFCIAETDYCQNGGTCLWQPTTEEPNCQCVLGYGGNRCMSIVTVMTDINPPYGPVSGGTLITLRGVNFNITPNPAPLVGSLLCSVVGDSTNEEIRCRTPGLNGRTAIQQMLQLTYPTGTNIVTNINFTYLPDPVIVTFFPLTSIVGGGTTMTVLGRHLLSVKYPELCIREIFAAEGIDLTYKHGCQVENATLMYCETPALNLSTTILDLLPDAAPSAGRRRRQANNQVMFRAGFALDGVTEYTDLMQITVHRDPVIERAKDPIDHRPFWPFSHKSFEIKGEGMAGAEPSEYVVGLGGGRCASLEISDNLIVCFPPSDKPGNGPDDDSNGRLAITVRIGTNIEALGGYLNFERNLWEYTPARIGISVGIVVVALLVAAIILCCVCKRRCPHLLGLRYAKSIEQFSDFGIRQRPNYPPSPRSRHGTLRTNTFTRAARLHNHSLSQRSVYSSLSGGFSHSDNYA